MKKSFGHPQGLSHPPDDDALVAPRDLPVMGIHYSRNHLRVMWQSGRFPAPVHLSPRRIAWRKRDVVAWIASKTTAVR